MFGRVWFFLTGGFTPAALYCMLTAHNFSIILAADH
jgi:hypothetical protein